MIRLRLNPLKWSYPEYILVMFIPGILYVFFLALDLYGTPNLTVIGQVISEQENWTLKHQYKCYFIIDSENLGNIETSEYGRCRHALVPGQKVQLEVSIGRITGYVGVTHGSIKKIN